MPGKIIYLIIVLAVLFQPAAGEPFVLEKPSIAGTRGWRLIWSDEFDGDQIDASKWRIENAALVKNNEQQYYTPKNVFLKDGKLVLKSDKQQMGGRPYTSGLVETKGRFAFQYDRAGRKSE